MVLLISLFSFLLLLFLMLALVAKEPAQSPLERIKNLDVYTPHDPDNPEDAQKKNAEGPIRKLARFIPKTEFGITKLRVNLIYSDTKYTLEEITLVKILSSSTLGFATIVLSKNFFIGFMILLVVWFIPNFYIGRKAQKRLAEFNSQIADGLLVISNALKAGYSFLQAVSLVAKEMPDPFSKEFTILLKEMSFGLTMEESFHNITTRIDSEDLNLVVNAILIQKDVGGNLSEIIDKIVDTIRERQRIKGEVKTLTAQGRFSGLIIAMLPFTLGGLLFLINHDYLAPLFQNSLGLGMVTYGLISQGIGYFMIRKITDIEL